MTWGINSRCFQISICGLKMSISCSLPVKITPDFFSGNFYCTKNSVLKFYEESLTFFQLSRSFPPLSASQVSSQSTAWWVRSCSIRNRSIDNPNQNFRMMNKLVHLCWKILLDSTEKVEFSQNGPSFCKYLFRFIFRYISGKSIFQSEKWS